MFRACRHHTIRLVCAFGDKVVYKHADVRLVPCKNQSVFAVYFSCGVYAGNQTLSRRFFVSAASVHLPCREQSFHRLAFKRRKHPERIETIILYCVAVFCKATIFKPRQSAIHLLLHVVRKRSGHALHVHLFAVCAFRFDKDLVAFFVFESHNLRFNGRAIARAYRQNRAVVKRTSVDVVEDDFVRFFVGIREIARLFHKRRAWRHKGKSVAVIPQLNFHFGKSMLSR